MEYFTLSPSTNRCAEGKSLCYKRWLIIFESLCVVLAVCSREDKCAPSAQRAGILTIFFGCTAVDLSLYDVQNSRGHSRPWLLLLFQRLQRRGGIPVVLAHKEADEGQQGDARRPKLTDWRWPPRSRNNLHKSTRLAHPSHFIYSWQPRD